MAVALPLPKHELPQYIIIAPTRDEEKHLPGTIESVANQTILPKLWVIVDDGSTDRTGQIADEAARRYSWIKVVHRPRRADRRSGGGVIEAFYNGFGQIPDDSWDYLVKMDGDLTFGPDYFENCFKRFEEDAKLGIGGGSICLEIDGRLELESRGDPPFHVRGAAKIYRAECWQEIGGLRRETGWDTLDEVKANMLGWKTHTFAGLNLIHHRPTGGADGTWKNWIKNGRANYFVGYHPLFMLGKCVKRLLERPYGIVSLALLYGYVSGYLSKAASVGEPEVIRYLRREQLRRMLLRESIWK